MSRAARPTSWCITKKNLVPLWLLLLGTSGHLAAQSSVVAADEALRRFQPACKIDLWGAPLCGRLVLVERKGREAVATHSDPDGKFERRGEFYHGKLPEGVPMANTAVEWGGQRWAMAMLPLPEEPYARTRLLAHESFHRLQHELELRAGDPLSAHLDSETGRLWLRMELRALGQALRAEGEAGKEATHDALVFREMRYSLHPEAREREAALEIQEGLAQYTGTVVALRHTGEAVSRVAMDVERFVAGMAYARSFAYQTGPALGLLLDRYREGWRQELNSESNVARMLAEAVEFRVPGELEESARQRGERYEYRAVAAAERGRELRRQKRDAELRALFLEGPVLRFPEQRGLRRSFNPGNLIPFGEHGTVYPTGTFSSDWGKLTVDKVGALVAPDNRSLRVAAPKEAAARPLTGPGWRLELAEGWTVLPSDSRGDFEVTPIE